MANQPKWLYDGALSFEGGVDGGRPPVTLPINQCAYAVNTSFRGGFPKRRPKVRRLSYDVDASVLSDWSTAKFQGASGYTDLDGNGHVWMSIGGRLYSIKLDDATQYIYDASWADPALRNNPNREKMWFAQAEEFLIAQDGQSNALIWDGSSLYRAAQDQIPVGTRMAYGIGRLWVSQGAAYYGGDLVYSDPSRGRESVLHFTENEFLSEGGAFQVPTAGGDITGFAFTAKQDTVSGEGSLMVFTDTGIFEFDAPVDRTAWAQTTQPLQRFSLLNFGAKSHESIINVNGDLFFRSEDGIRSFYFARRDFQSWGNTPISREVGNLLALDNKSMLRFASAANFNNRALFTASPEYGTNGPRHRRLVSLDFDLISGMQGKSPPAWEGEWTFDFEIYQVVTVDTAKGRRCILITTDEDETFGLWELLLDHLDADETMTWGPDTRAMVFESPMQLKQIQTMEAWLDGVKSAVNMDVWWKRNSSGCWTPWGRYSAAGPDCAETGCTPPTLKGAVSVNRVGMPMANGVADTDNCDYTSHGYDFQLRIRFNADAVLRRIRVGAQIVDQTTPPDFTNSCTELTSNCETCS